MLLLASGSPRRAKILTFLGIPYKVVPNEASELDFADPVETCVYNATAKHSMAVAEYPGRWILAADTLVYFGGSVLGKPTSPAAAVDMLYSFSGKSQIVFTAVALSSPEMTKPDIIVEASSVKFREFTRELAAEYIASAKTCDRAGAYDIDVNSDMIIECYTGSRFNIMGLPGERVLDWWRAHAR